MPLLFFPQLMGLGEQIRPEQISQIPTFLAEMLGTLEYITETVGAAINCGSGTATNCRGCRLLDSQAWWQ